MIPAKRLAVPFVVAVTLALGACATNQIDSKQAAEQKARGVSGDVWVASNQIDATMLSLDNLMAADASQLPQAFTRYSADVDLLHKQADRINEDGTALRKQSDDQLMQWHNQNNEIRNSDLHDNSEQGRRTVWDRSHDVQVSYDWAQSSMDRLLRNLEDVRIALRNDLSTRGMAGISDTNLQKRAHAHAGEAKADLQQVQSDSNALAAVLSPSAKPIATSDHAAERETDHASDAVSQR